MKAILHESSKCPVCGEREAINRIEIDSADNFYLASTRTAFNLTNEFLNDKILTYECLSCSSIFCDPFFSNKTCFEIFNLVYPQHNRGWEVLYDWVDGKVKQSYEGLFRQVEKRIGKIQKYGELNCPYQGNFLWMSNFLWPDIITRKAAFLGFTEMSKQNRLDYWMKKFKFWIFKYKKFRFSKVVHALNNLQANSIVKNIPPYRVLITSETTKFWGVGCFANATSCRALAASMLDVDVLPLWGSNAKDQDIDCIGVFNVLDHIDNPLETIFKLLDLGKYVLLVNHGQKEITKQHHFVLGAKFSSFLQSRGLNVIDLTKEAIYHTDEVNSEKIILLISKDK